MSEQVDGEGHRDTLDRFVAALYQSQLRAEFARNFIRTSETQEVQQQPDHEQNAAERNAGGVHEADSRRSPYSWSIDDAVGPRRQSAANCDYNRCYSPDELAAMDTCGKFRVPSVEDSDRIFTKCAASLATTNNLACAVCEMAFPPTDISHVPVTESLLNNARNHLLPPAAADIPQFIIDQYDASTIDPTLQGLLLFPPAVLRSSGATQLQLCTDCNTSIAKNHLPRMAIANGNWIGKFPLGEIPWIEEQLIALVSPCVSIKTVTGGRQRCLRSHHYIVKNTAGPILKMLPHEAASRIRVTMVGAMTPEQIAICKKRHTINVERSRAALDFMLNNHKSYEALREERETVAVAIQDRLADVVEDRTDATAHPVRGPVVERIDDTSSYAVPAVNLSDDARDETEWVEENSIVLDQAEQADDYLVRQSTAFMTTQRWADCVDMFPTLFPGGCGGPKEPRRKALSVTAWARRLLRLHGCAFQRHDVFLLLVFDYLALENARSRMFFRLKATRDAIRAGSVTREAIAECVEYRQHLIQRQAAGLKPDPPSEHIRQIINIQKGVEASEVAYYGSNKARAQARSDLFGYIRRFGPLHIFFTVSPDTSGVYSIGVQSGVIDAAQVREANLYLLPTKTERRKIASRHPVECARYFIRVMDTVIQHVLGWDEDQQLPTRDGGLFGVVKAYTASAETQVSGDLHAHFVVWLHGLPSTGSAMEEKLKDADFCKRYLQLIDAVSTLKIPGVDHACPDCGVDATAIPIPLQAYQRQPKTKASPVPTSSCRQCNRSFGSHDILNHAITRMGDPSPGERDFILCSDAATRPVNEVDRDVAIILREVQIHFWHHTPSCFKVTKNTPTAAVCRFLRPVAPQLLDTYVDDNLEIRQHRPIGSEYLNAYNAVLTRLLRCNHDVRFILNGSSKDVAAYICKYVTKAQNRIENDLAFRLGAMQRVTTNVDARNAGIQLSDKDRGNKILSGLIYAMTNRQEMPASMAALLVLRASPFWTSHPVVSLNVELALATMDNANDDDEEEVSIPVHGIERDARVFHKPNFLRAYWNRPSELEHLSLVEVMEQYAFVKTKWIKNKPIKVACVRGMKTTSVDEDTESSVRQKYYRILCVLFKPHRQNTVHSTNYEQDYLTFVESSTSPAVGLAQQFTTNLQDSNRASSMSDKPSAEEILLSNNMTLTGLTTDLGEREDSDSDEEDITSARFGLIEEVPDTSALHRLSRYDDQLDQDPVLSDTINEFAEQVICQPTCNQAEETRTEVDGPSTGTATFIQLFTTLPTRLEKLTECFNPVPWSDPTTTPHLSKDEIPRFAKIADVSLAFELNAWQHYAFETTARHVLYKYLTDIEDAIGEKFPRPTHHTLHPQLIGYMGGEAGGGKSTVIHALLAFARSWERVGSIETLSFTGVAAITIQGRTIHGARNLSVDENKDSNPSSEMRAKFARVVLTIIDEISMTDQRLLGRADAVTRTMRGTKNIPWGGCHVLLCGDWKQIPPVAGTPVYEPNTSHTTASQAYALYSSINFVVFLIDNMRSRLDPVYTSILRRMRWGNLTTQDIERLNSRVGVSCGNVEPTNTVGFFRPVVAGTNLLRCAINFRTTLEVGRRGKAQVFQAVARPAPASRANFQKFCDFDDHLTSRIPLKFFYFVGMPVMITHRLNDPDLHDVVANGTIGHIVGHELTPIPCQQSSVDGVSIFVHTSLPVRLILRVKDCHSVLKRGYPPGIIPVEPLHTRVDIETKTCSKKRGRYGPSITVDQFPMVPAFACTPEKLQGQTCKDGIIISDLQRSARKISPQALYVSFSRTVSLDKLTLTHPISQLDAGMFTPRPETVQEMQRLQGMIVPPAYFDKRIIDNFHAWKNSQRPHMNAAQCNRSKRQRR